VCCDASENVEKTWRDRGKHNGALVLVNAWTYQILGPVSGDRDTAQAQGETAWGAAEGEGDGDGEVAARPGRGVGVRCGTATAYGFIRFT
jgi:hypothetical protein